jgi:DNA-binding beta-propeller fold protein YncE
MYVYDASTAQPVAQLNTPGYVWYEPFVANNKGQIYIFDTYWLSIIDRATNTSSTHSTDTNVYPEFLYYNAVENKIYAIGNGYLILTLNEEGKVLTEERRSFPANVYSLELFIENSSLIFVRSEDKLKILDLNDGTCLSTGLTEASYYSSPKAILANNNIYVANGTNQIYKLSATDYSVIQKINTRVTPQNMFIANGYLYYLGQYQSNSYLLDKIKL